MVGKKKEKKAAPKKETPKNKISEEMFVLSEHETSEDEPALEDFAELNEFVPSVRQISSSPVMEKFEGTQEGKFRLEEIEPAQDSKKETSTPDYITVSNAPKYSASDEARATEEMIVSRTISRPSESSSFLPSAGLHTNVDIPELRQAGTQNAGDDYLVSEISEREERSRLPFERRSTIEKEIHFKKYEPR